MTEHTSADRPDFDGYAQPLAELLAPDHLFSRSEVLGPEDPVPRQPGVYAWYFDSAASNAPFESTPPTAPWGLMYVGISPKAPPRNGRPASRQTLRSRIRYHFRGNAAGSTLRLTLGSLLSESLGIQLRRVGSGERMTFSDGEKALSQWMEDHARVCWVIDPTPWLIEEHAISRLSLPLNLDQNRHSSFHTELSAARAAQRAAARSLPVLPR